MRLLKQVEFFGSVSLQIQKGFCADVAMIDNKNRFRFFLFIETKKGHKT